MASPAVNGVSTPPRPTNQPTPPTTHPSSQAADTSIAPQPLPSSPGTSLNDDGSTRRPRDIRNIHLLLASNGVQAYQERVPLMLLDYAYRYTSSILTDAQAMTAEAVHDSKTSKRDKDEGGVSLNSLRQAIAARNHFHIQPQLSKEDVLGIASEVNRVVLPRPERDFGLRLPHEKYCLVGGGFGLREEWSDEEEEESDEELGDAGEAPEVVENDEVMKDGDGQEDDKGLEDEEIDREEFEDVMMGGQEGAKT